MKLPKPAPLLVLICLGLLYSCQLHDGDEKNQNVEGYRPEYGTPQSKEISMLSPRPVNNPGKIYVYGHYLLVNENKKGIHVFDNTDPHNPRPIGFIQVVGNTDMAIRNDVLYADHMGNITAIRLGDFTTVESLQSLHLGNWDLGVPPPPGFYFECVDPEKGLVTGWTKVNLQNPECYAKQ